MLLESLRERIVEAAVWCYRDNLVQGTAGNVSARDEETGYVVITPSGVPYENLQPSDIVVVDLSGSVIDGHLIPSSETPMHTAIYRALPQVHGVVHTHSVFATTFACLGRPIPAVHYLVALVGVQIPVADYATYGTPEMGTNVLRVIGDSKAVLLKNHGVLAIGRSLTEALTVASTVEYVAQVSYLSLVLGRPEELPRDELERLAVRFSAYGQRPHGIPLT